MCVLAASFKASKSAPEMAASWDTTASIGQCHHAIFSRAAIVAVSKRLRNGLAGFPATIV
jgi:hypothetical protein